MISDALFTHASVAFLDPIVYLLFFTAILAGFIDAAAGGGGLITLPVLMVTGISPLQALATNKLQGSFGSLVSSLHFFRKGFITIKRLPLMLICCAAGSATGSGIALVIGNESLLILLPFVLSILALYLFFSKDIGSVEKTAKISDKCYATTIATGIGAYDGFLGPGTGSFFALSLVKFLGMDYITATAYAKTLNFSANLIALIVFIISGHVLFTFGLVMIAGQIIGSSLGSRMAIAKGAGYIRLLTVLMCIALSIKIIASEYPCL